MRARADTEEDSQILRVGGAPGRLRGLGGYYPKMAASCQEGSMAALMASDAEERASPQCGRTQTAALAARGSRSEGSPATSLQESVEKMRKPVYTIEPPGKEEEVRLHPLPNMVAELR